MIVEPGDPDLEKLFLERIQTAAQEGLRPLCPIPLVRKDGRWESWTAPAGHPHRIAYSELAVDYFSEVYAVQQPMLYRYTEDWDDPCFIASYMAKADEKYRRMDIGYRLVQWNRFAPTQSRRDRLCRFILGGSRHRNDTLGCGRGETV